MNGDNQRHLAMKSQNHELNLPQKDSSPGTLFCLFDLGLMSLSTIFQSYRYGVWMWQGAQCSLLECASLKYHALDTLT